MALKFGASIAIDPTAGDVVADIKGLTERRGADVTIEALGRQDTFEAALRSLRPGGTLSSLGDQRIVTTLCRGGKERMRRLLSMVQHDRIDLTPLITHHFFALEALPEAFDLFLARPTAQ